ncbi:MAG TPA: diguanylate cyclase, partial [Methylophilus sp.]|nr:diguanylate cyclase [Methylophilus sp.]
MQSLIDLTKVRESLALDPALLSLMQHWLGTFAGQAQPIKMQVLSRRQLVSVMDPKVASTDPAFEALPADVYKMLLGYLDQEHRQHQCLETAIGKLHIFPLSQSIAHKNAILLIQHAALSTEAVALVEQCLQMFHYYARLIIENERDGLTGLLNRKTFDQCVSKILLNDYKPEYRFPLHHYLVIFDIDFFKRINDN